MDEIDEEWVRTRAYMLWERNGRQHGQDQDHWEQARREYAEMISAAESVTEKSRERVRAAASSATRAEVTR